MIIHKKKKTNHKKKEILVGIIYYSFNATHRIKTNLKKKKMKILRHKLRTPTPLSGSVKQFKSKSHCQWQTVHEN